MKKTLLAIFMFSTLLFANSFKVGENIGTFSLPNQFDEKKSINSDVKLILVSFEKDTGKEVNTFLASKPKEFLALHNAVFIANISGMPSIITKLFAMPKMREYKHSILLIYDEEDDRFVKEDEKTTIYKLENGVIKSISYVTADELEKVFE
ncbi:hypothetical protein CRV08_14230 [Halarcobacter ebronensis]|uniref:FAD/FMN-containing dehydrogenase n=1 Tax=Halarcobacter ebronensis TaxID=1462615 RepID=A0A4V1LQT5_9BACT|nr:hypothetical protein [Halarcobacter ebronensis]RXJ65818.1 hypothetical protein CRV08_14230 [Halarcobacter ebronensis]